jgi:long-chain acyl-CoA synthetase
MTETAPAPAQTGPSDERRTIVALWRDAAQAVRPYPAYLVESEEGWREISWRDADASVRELANGLLARGVRKGDTFAILAQNSLEWALVDFALAHVGAVSVPIYANSAPSDVHYLLEHSEAVGIVCGDADQLAKVESQAAALPLLTQILTYADLAVLAEEGKEFESAHPTALSEAAAAVTEDDLYTIIYTSGTTGPPKGCMLSHRNYFVMASVGDAMEERYLEDDDVMLLYLPLAHNFGRLMLLSGAHIGFTIAFLGDPLRVPDALLQVRPTVLPSVPRVYEKVHAAVVARFDEATGLKRRLIDWALPIGREASRLREQGRPLPRGLELRLAIADRLVFRKVRERLGGRLRIPISGGAPLSREVMEFFDAIGIRIVEGYGLTECTTACTFNNRDPYRFGSVGPALPGFEVRTAEDGELLVRSETVFQGYFKDPAATAATLTSDGWLKTGDIGDIDENGLVTITDRKKDIIVTAGGKNVAPQNIENAIKTSKFVSQALVVGDRRPYVSALITLDADEIGRWAKEREIEGDVAALSRDARVHDLVEGIVEGVNRERSRFEQLKRFAILPRDFTMDAGEVTQTLKLRRTACLEHFREEVERLYAPSSEPADR